MGIFLPLFLKENNYFKSPWYCRYRAHLWVFLSPLSCRNTIIVKVIGIADFVPTYGEKYVVSKFYEQVVLEMYLKGIRY